MISSNFYNPNIQFKYVCDSILWGKIFPKPFPLNLSDQRKGDINLSHYFDCNPITVLTGKGKNKERKMITPGKRFFRTVAEKRKDAFLTLCQFLIHFNRPHRDCYVRIPHHSGLKQRERFTPMDFYYKEPTYPVVDKEENMLRIDLNQEKFAEVYQYTFGVIPDDPDLVPAFLFPFSYFGGFVLQY